MPTRPGELVPVWCNHFPKPHWYKRAWILTSLSPGRAFEDLRPLANHLWLWSVVQGNLSSLSKCWSPQQKHSLALSGTFLTHWCIPIDHSQSMDYKSGHQCWFLYSWTWFFLGLLCTESRRGKCANMCQRSPRKSIMIVRRFWHFYTFLMNDCLVGCLQPSQCTLQVSVSMTNALGVN